MKIPGAMTRQDFYEVACLSARRMCYVMSSRTQGIVVTRDIAQQGVLIKGTP